ncbi:MAG: hypothetical protein JXC85_01755 [Candidatus Aenigmarchaeota archaeon]|nr:hypothetical protein [Candidatus Aenigmarchaeota archaeon]
MKKNPCGVCKRSKEHLGLGIKTVWCEKANTYLCKDCCIKNKGSKCHYWTMCWSNSA